MQFRNCTDPAGPPLALGQVALSAGVNYVRCDRGHKGAKPFASIVCDGGGHPRLKARNIGRSAPRYAIHPAKELSPRQIKIANSCGIAPDKPTSPTKTPTIGTTKPCVR